MRNKLIEIGIPSAVGVICATLLGVLVYGYVRPGGFSERPLGMDQFRVAVAPGGQGASAPGAPAGVSFSNAKAAVAVLPGAWPGFRGPLRDGVSADATPLAPGFGPAGPPVLWSATLGEGYAGPVVLNSRVYLIDYDQGAQSDAIRCFSLADGSELWRRSYPEVVKRNHGMSRTVPFVNDKLVVTLGPKCRLTCCDAATGEMKWQHDLVSEYGVTVPEWYAGQCPLVVDGMVVIGTGGSALVVAFDAATGKEKWRSPNPGNWAMTHSSIMPMTVNGVKTLVYAGSGGVAAVAAAGGKILWSTDEWVINTATVPTPIVAPGNRLFLCGGYDSGAMMLQVDGSAAGMSVKTLWRVKASVFSSDQQTPILYKDHLYGVITGGQMVCLKLDGTPAWSSGPMNRYGLGPYMIAGGMLYILDDKGTLTVADASPAGFKKRSEARILEGPDAWGPLALAGGRLLARDLTRMVCLDVAAH